MNVLFVTKQNGCATGHSDDFRAVRAKTAADVGGMVLPVRIISYRDETYEAEII